MDALAKEAGVARATVYEHFRSKRAVLDELASSISRTIVLDEERTSFADPLVALRNMLSEVCQHWNDAEERIRGLRTLNALTGTEQTNDGVEEKQLQRLVQALADGGQLRPHWSVEEAVDALAVLTSYATYERLRAAPRTPQQIEAVLAKLAVAMVSPSAVAPNPISGASVSSNST